MQLDIWAEQVEEEATEKVYEQSEKHEDSYKIVVTKSNGECYYHQGTSIMSPNLTHTKKANRIRKEKRPD